MAASVGMFPSGYGRAGMQGGGMDPYKNMAPPGEAAYNNDPGVYDPECDWADEEPAYPDTRQHSILKAWQWRKNVQKFTLDEKPLLNFLKP